MDFDTLYGDGRLLCIPHKGTQQKKKTWWPTTLLQIKTPPSWGGKGGGGLSSFARKDPDELIITCFNARVEALEGLYKTKKKKGIYPCKI